MKSRAASKGSAEAARRAAERTYADESPLPLSQTAVADAAEEGRHRLSGAFAIELSRIRRDPTQPRKNLDTDKQRELNASVRQLGILQAITVRYIAEGGFYQIISGERRYQAARAAGLSEMPCWEQKPKSEEILLRQIVENWQRADLQPLELSEALTVLRDANHYSQKQIAQLTGKPESEISRLLSLSRTDPKVQQVARENPARFTKRHLTAIAQLEEPADQRNVMVEVQQNNLTVVETERRVKEERTKRQGTKTRGAPTSRSFRFTTTSASVLVTFRKQRVTAKEVVVALDEARRLATVAAREQAAK